MQSRYIRVKIATFRLVVAIMPTIVGNMTIKQHVIRGVAKQVQVGGICYHLSLWLFRRALLVGLRGGWVSYRAVTNGCEIAWSQLAGAGSNEIRSFMPVAATSRSARAGLSFGGRG